MFSKQHFFVFFLLALIFGVLILPSHSRADQNPCPVNPYTNIQWAYDPAQDSCTYPKIIAGRGDTGQQTDIVMRVDTANAYVLNVRSPADLFLRPAQWLNNRALTNMSNEALAALAYAQVYVEEKWFKDYNWVHPYANSNLDPVGGAWPSGTSLNGKRSMAALFGAYNDWAYSLNSHGRPYRLGGFGFGPGNELFGQAWDSGQWYIEYVQLTENRYGFLVSNSGLDKSPALQALAQAMHYRDNWLLSPDISAMVRGELLSTEYSQFWNILRFVWSATRHREGAYPDNRSMSDIERQAIDYNQLLGHDLVGRPQRDISAFALMTTIYTDSIVVSQVTGYDGTRYIARDHRTDAEWRNYVSERNKAIRNVELLGSASAEGLYRIQQALGIKLLTTQYEDPTGGDFLPYSGEEAISLIKVLNYEINESGDEWVANEALRVLTNAKMLQAAYKFYTGRALEMPTPP